MMESVLDKRTGSSIASRATTAPEATGRRQSQRGRPMVNQAGYNRGEAKRFTCPGAPDETVFRVLRMAASTDAEVVFEGVIRGEAGDFTALEPDQGPFAGCEYVVEVDGFGRSEPFRIADHLMETVSTRLAYQFFIDVRGGFQPTLSPANVTGGGPSRDGGGSCLEATFEGLLYASNPALFHRWTDELRWYQDRLWPDVPAPPARDEGLPPHVLDGSAAPEQTPDLIKLLLWHAGFCFANVDYDGPTGGFEGRAEGYEGWVRQFGHVGEGLRPFDRQNMLDQLAATCAYYHAFLKPYLPAATYQRYRHACLTRWERYERQREVRYWVHSQKWIDEGWLEFNEQGSAFGQGLLRNLLMAVAERQEPDGQAERFFQYARQCAQDIVAHWDFENPVHTWRARNAEHITPQSLALLLMLAPEHAPEGTHAKLQAWRDYIVARTTNLWQYRTHSDDEWAHPRSKEIGTVAGLGGAMFAVAHVLDDANLRALGWSQVNFVFGCNPAGTHLGQKSALRVALDGWWEGVERGWPFPYVHGTGSLGACRGTLDGSPVDAAFPFDPEAGVTGDKTGVYSSEGWSLTNRAWLATVAFSTLGTHSVRCLRADADDDRVVASVRPGERIRVELRAALNHDWHAAETGWVDVVGNGRAAQRVIVTESSPNSGRFVGEFTVAADAQRIGVSYGYLASRVTADVEVR